MAATCSICSSPRRADAERAIASGETIRATAHRLDLSRDALGRHVRSGHVPMAIERRTERAAAEHAVDLTDRAEDLYRRAEAILERAEGRPTVELAAVRELRGIVELLAKLIGPPPKPVEPTVIQLRVHPSNSIPPTEARLGPLDDEEGAP